MVDETKVASRLEHPFFGRLEEAAGLLDETIERAESNGREVEHQRLRVQVQAALNNAAAIDVDLFPPEVLTGANNKMEQVLGQLRTYQQQGNVQHLSQAAASMQSVLQNISPFLLAADGPRDSVPSSVTATLEEIRAEVRGATESSTGLQKELDEAKKDLAAVAKQTESQMSVIQQLSKDWSVERDNQLKHLAERMNSIAESFEVRVESQVKELEGTNKEAVERQTQLVNQWDKQHQEWIAKQTTAFEKKGQDTLQAMGALQKQAENLLADTAGDRISTEFAGRAATNEKSARAWRRGTAIAWALVVLVGMAWFIPTFFIGTPTGTASERAADALSHGVGFAVTAALAVYTGAQARHFQEQANRYGHAASVLQALPPYLAEMKTEERTQVLRDHLPWVFRLHDGHEMEDDTPSVGAGLKKVVNPKSKNP